MIKTTSDERDALTAIKRGLMLRCPCCGKGKMFARYLKVVQKCDCCGEELFHHEADDAPPYFTMFVVGHIVVAGVLALEMERHPPLWVHMAVWLPLTVILSLALLPVIKGAVVALQWANRMHGFGSSSDSTQGL